MTGPGWMENVFTFYDPAGAAALSDALRGFEGGRLVVNMVDMPIKCPVAPLEFAFLADWYLHDRGIRDDCEITYVTPLDGAFTKPVASQRLAGLLEEKGIDLVTEFAPGEVDGPGGRLISYDEREVGVRPARHHPAARRGRASSPAQPGSATSWASSPPIRTRCRRRPRRTSSRSATPPTCRRRRRARSRTSRRTS